MKENIGKFGGDPDLVTIFGQSAGAGSVAAQTMGQHNDGLFKRAIQEVRADNKQICYKKLTHQTEAISVCLFIIFINRIIEKSLW